MMTKFIPGTNSIANRHNKSPYIAIWKLYSFTECMFLREVDEVLQLLGLFSAYHNQDFQCHESKQQ